MSALGETLIRQQYLAWTEKRTCACVVRAMFSELAPYSSASTPSAIISPALGPEEKMPTTEWGDDNSASRSKKQEPKKKGGVDTPMYVQAECAVRFLFDQELDLALGVQIRLGARIREEREPADPVPHALLFRLPDPRHLRVRVHHARNRVIIHVAVVRVDVLLCLVREHWPEGDVGVTLRMHLMLGTLVLNWSSITMRPREHNSTPTCLRPRPLMYGRRPMATRTASASICGPG